MYFFFLLIKTLYVKKRYMRIIEIIIHIYVFWVFFRKSAKYTPCTRSIIKDAIVAPTLTKNALIVMFWTMLYATRACLVGVFLSMGIF